MSPEGGTTCSTTSQTVSHSLIPNRGYGLPKPEWPSGYSRGW